MIIIESRSAIKWLYVQFDQPPRRKRGCLNHFTVVRRTLQHVADLIVGVAPEPVLFAEVTEKVLTSLVVGKDDSHEGHCRDPVKEVDGTSAEGSVERGDVAEKGAKSSFPHETKVEPTVAHTLSVQRKLTSLAAHEIGPLHDDDGNEEGALSVGEGLFRVVAGISVGVIVQVKATFLERLRNAIDQDMTEPAALENIISESSQVITVKGVGSPGKDRGIKAIVVQDAEVGVETGDGLNDTNLEV